MVHSIKYTSLNFPIFILNISKYDMYLTNYKKSVIVYLMLPGTICVYLFCLFLRQGVESISEPAAPMTELP
jgi:hypothetical protein